MSRRLYARLGKLEVTAQAAPDDTPLCAFHGGACRMGAEPLSELYRLVIEAKARAGEQVPPPDEHREMTPAERVEYERGAAELLAEQKAKNEVIEAQLRGERP